MMDNFGQYRLIERIASGGMGEIFRARLVREGGFEKIVAVKRMLPSLSEKGDFSDRFTAEAKLSARLNHTNIVHIYDFGSMAGAHFLAMEYVEGVDLGAFLEQINSKEQNVPPHLALRIAADSLKGLDYAHRLKDENAKLLNLIHRDISPSNILISYEGEVKLTDFGLAGVLEGDCGDMLMGKLAYMPPEQVKGEPVDRRSDIYSLTLVLYEMIYGRKAFPSGIPTDALMRSITAGALDFPELDGVPAALVEIMKKGAHVEKASRFNTAREMLLAIEEQIDLLKTNHVSLPSLLAELFPERVRGRTVLPEKTIVSDGLSASPDIKAKANLDGREDGASGEPPVSDGEADEYGLPSKAKSGSILRPTLTALVGLLLATVALWLWLPRTGSLLLSSIPPGARIYLDGEDVGRLTPATLEGVSVGTEHEYRVDLLYHQPRSGTFSLEAGEMRPVELKLLRGQREAKLVTHPIASTAWLNGSKLDGLTPLTIGELLLGVRQSLRIEKEGFIPLQTEFIIGEMGEEARVFNFELQSMYTSLLIEVEPQEAVVYLDGIRRKGRSPHRIEKLLPSRHVDIVASLEGYSSKSLQVEPGKQTGALRIRLERLHCDLLLDGPAGASISANGRKHKGKVQILSAQQKVQLLSISPSGEEGRLVMRIRVNQLLDRKGRYIPQAVINFDAQPWATIRIDNGKPFATPSSGNTLRSGSHRLWFSLGNGGKEHSFRLQLTE